jgi:UDP-N-acetylglucosamine 2-epimerase (non-hydrolysing)
MKVQAVVGARPNLMKMAPLMDEMASRPGVRPVLVHTGQHYDERMSELFFRQLGIPEPDHYLDVRSGRQAEQTARAMMRLEELALESPPDLMLVVGDVNSTLAAALVAAKLRIPLAHVEAGLRSFDRGMPEEVNRVLTDAVSDLLFTTERSARDNLLREGIADERIHFVGNVMIDTLERHLPRARELDAPASAGLERDGYALLTLHRPSNVDDPAVLGPLVDAVLEAAEAVPVVFPTHPRTLQKLTDFGLLGRIEGSGRVRVLEPLGYLEFLGLMDGARVVLTDSGGIQEETTILGVPCVTLRENTERPATVTHGTNRVVGVDRDAVLAGFREALQAGRDNGRRPELWDGRAAGRIVDVLERSMADRRVG